MTPSNATRVKCPICKTDVPWVPEEKFKPFCSERCKLIDLGDWATESYKIPLKEVDAEEFGNSE
jgi:uncharacterized protein